MLVVISPAKTLDYATPVATRKHSEPEFAAQAKTLAAILRKLEPAELRRLMGISEALAELNHARFRAWSAAPAPDTTRQAIFAFMGDVYAGLDARTLGARDLDYAQSHLRILSGLYGLLRPLDLIQPHRLEMGTALANARGADLYAFWGARPAEALARQAAAVRTRYLVNLASNEYFRAVARPALDLEVITPVFKERRGRDYKVVGFLAKKARGVMARTLILERCRTPAALLAFDRGGYRYDAEQSSPHAPVFTREGAID